jgi:hypothetical protein
MPAVAIDPAVADELRELYRRYRAAQDEAERLVEGARQPLVTRVAELAARHSYEEIAAELPVGKSMIGLYVERARSTGV